MVSKGISSPSPSTDSEGEESQADTRSTISLNEQYYDGTIVIPHNDKQEESEIPCFGNVSVVNSNDIHFGNKTFYHGPVTIKQIYANKFSELDNCDSEVTNKEVTLDPNSIPNGGLDNRGYINDLPNIKSYAPKQNVTQEGNSGIIKDSHRLQKYYHKNFAILISFLGILIGTLVILLIVLLIKHSPISIDETVKTVKEDNNEQEQNTPIDAPDSQTNLTLPGKLKLVSRLEWLAQPSAAPLDQLNTPVPFVIIHHTATENCSSQAQCIFHVRYIQTFHIESRNWSDIGYNYLVGGDGEAYEGRGWKSEGAHSYGYNSRSIGIAFIGTFNSIRPPRRQVTACKQVIAKGVEQGFIQKNYKLFGARQLHTTQSPGNVLYQEIISWEHWAKQP